jgi:hypothetical protein
MLRLRARKAKGGAIVFVLKVRADVTWWPQLSFWCVPAETCSMMVHVVDVPNNSSRCDET